MTDSSQPEKTTQPNEKKHHDERILVIPIQRLWEILPQHQGFRAGNLELWGRLADDWKFAARDAVEPDPSLKQLIPYVILRSGEYVFRYWRTKRAGESRLHHLYSLGVGGHIDEKDMNLFTGTEELLLEAAAREVREEVEHSGELHLEHLGTLNDDSNDVGRVHLGLVFTADVGETRPETREAALGRGEWLKPSDLSDGVEYETWSQLLIPILQKD